MKIIDDFYKKDFEIELKDPHKSGLDILAEASQIEGFIQKKDVIETSGLESESEFKFVIKRRFDPNILGILICEMFGKGHTLRILISEKMVTKTDNPTGFFSTIIYEIYKKNIMSKIRRESTKEMGRIAERVIKIIEAEKGKG